MNYISHYHASQGYSDYTRLATLLPDVFSRFSYLHNRYFLHFDPNGLTDFERELWTGIAIHYADDASFHQMDSFFRYCRYIEDDIKASPALQHTKRLYFVSHILYELILDHLVLKSNPIIHDEIYAILDTIDRGKIEQFLRKIIGDDNEISLILKPYDQFSHRRFLNFYSHEENLVKALHRVTGKISQWEYNEETENSFIKIIQKLKLEIPFEKIFQYVEDHRKLK